MSVYIIFSIPFFTTVLSALLVELHSLGDCGTVPIMVDYCDMI